VLDSGGQGSAGSTTWIATAATALGLVVALVAAATALARASYQDRAGDANEAPDITTVAVDDTGGASVAVRVSFANFRTLPPNSRVLVRFDLDRDESTGDQGDEVTLRYSSDGTLASFRWDGAQLAPLPEAAASATFSDGVLSLAVDRAQLAGATSFGLLVIAARTQQAGAGLLASTDFAPSAGRNVYSSPGPASFADPDNDHDVAPDITSIEVVDTPSGSLQFRLTTANYATLPPDKLIGVGIGLRGRPIEDDALFLGYLSGSRTVEVDREERGVLQPILGRHGVTASHENGVLTFSLPRRLLDGAAAIGFGVVSADLVGPGESEGEEFEGEIEALDAAPDDLESLYPYRLANPGPLVFRATGVTASPVPRAGRGVTLRAVVRRLDTYRVVRQGSVTCTASVAGKRVRGTGRFRRGAAECALRVPGRAGSVLRGTITVRAAGAVSRIPFRYVLR
jgi:hypothetical protein